MAKEIEETSGAGAVRDSSTPGARDAEREVACRPNRWKHHDLRLRESDQNLDHVDKLAGAITGREERAA